MLDKPREGVAPEQALPETSATPGGPAVFPGRRPRSTWCDLLLDELGQDGFADTEPMTFIDATLSPAEAAVLARR